MITNFPNFKKLGLEDKPLIESFVKRYLPYSDFNFVSLWSYDTDNSYEISYLNKNLVIKQDDYITNEPFKDITRRHIRRRQTLHVDLPPCQIFVAA